jgi:hypothetical protein
MILPKGAMMRTAPSILLLDDGELERQGSLLAGLGADFVHLRGCEVDGAVPLPRDLLVTSLRLAREVPAFEHPARETLKPTWVCVADKNSRPPRKQLRDLGVHYLLDSQLDAESTRLFFLHLLGRASASQEAGNDCEDGSERRTHPRREYRRRLWALGRENVSVVLGRDLSLTGIRLEQNSCLSMGDQVELALYGGAREEPLVVAATVVRDDAESGLGLRFEALTTSQTHGLQQMLGSLPPVESLCEEKAAGVVVSTVVRRAD